LQLVQYLFESFGAATWETIRYSWVGFKIVVLNYYGSLSSFRPPLSFPMAVGRAFIWVASLIQRLVLKTGSLFMQKAFPVQKSSSSSLSLYAPEIDVQHLRSLSQSIDVSHVPPTVQVADLLKMFDEANFNQVDQPGYVKPEGDLGALKNQLKTFVTHVNQRKPFLGTPPASDIPLLLKFYQYIEDAVRFSVHKVNQDLAEFLKEKSGGFEGYSLEDWKKYKDLRENQARLCMDLAVAGEFCGARFLAVASRVYSERSEGGSGLAPVSLEDQVIACLAEKRKEIATACIEQTRRGNVHYYTAYMQNMGPLLGIPGTDNMVEHLLSRFDTRFALGWFFKYYTEDCIVETINEKVKQSASFREAIFDWIKAQVQDWNREHYRRLVDERMQAIQIILQKNIEMPSEVELINQFLKYVEGAGADLRSCASWEGLIDKLFALDSVKGTFAGKKPQQALQAKACGSRLKALGRACQENVWQHIQSGAPLNLEPFLEAMVQKDKLAQLRQMMPLLSAEQAQRLLKQDGASRELIEDITNQERARDFLHQFSEEYASLDRITQEGLPPKIMEWFLVSHRILSPQSELRNPEAGAGKASDQLLSFKRLFQNSVCVSDAERGWLRATEQEGAAELLLSCKTASRKRYYAVPRDPRKALLADIFLRVFRADPEKVIKLGREVADRNTTFYPLSNERMLRSFRAIASYSSPFMIPWIVDYYLQALYRAKLGPAQNRLTQHMVDRLMLPLVNYTPLTVIRAANRVLTTLETRRSYSSRILLAFVIFRQAIPFLPEIPILTNYVRQISMQDVLSFFLYTRIRQGSQIELAAQLAVYELVKSVILPIFDSLKNQALRMANREMAKSKRINQTAALRLFFQAFPPHSV
jgi:hypothetical protein